MFGMTWFIIEALYIQNHNVMLRVFNNMIIASWNTHGVLASKSQIKGEVVWKELFVQSHVPPERMWRSWAER
jgi:hypothetical protein